MNDTCTHTHTKGESKGKWNTLCWLTAVQVLANAIDLYMLLPDESKFGFRMLESMGWKKGRGLGANESGIMEHVKTVKRSNADTRGRARTCRRTLLSV